MAATALVAWLVVWQTPPANDAVQSAPLGDLEILLGEEDLEMLDEELEFYGWLEEQPEFAMRATVSVDAQASGAALLALAVGWLRAQRVAAQPEPAQDGSRGSGLGLSRVSRQLGPKRTTSGSRSRSGRRTTAAGRSDEDATKSPRT